MEIMLLGIMLVFAAFFAIGMLMAMAITFKLAILAVILVVAFRIARKVSQLTMDHIVPNLEILITKLGRVVFTFGWVFLLVIALRAYRQSESTQVATVVQESETFQIATASRPSVEPHHIANRLEEKLSRIIEDRTEKVVSKLEDAQEKIKAAQEKIKQAHEQGDGAKKDPLISFVAVDSDEDDDRDDKKVEVIVSSPKSPSRPKPEQKSQPKTIRFESGPCATPEKARNELDSKIEQYISQEQRSSGQAISISPKKVLAGMKIKPTIDVEYKEVGGDKYPVFKASVVITPDENLVRRMLVQANQAVARDRFEVLLVFSVGLAAFLGIWSRLV